MRNSIRLEATMRKIALVAALTVGVSGCTAWSPAMKQGALYGGLIGAGAGAVATGTLGGAAVGGAIGAGVGAAIGSTAP
jgi:hypothetical protein